MILTSEEPDKLSPRQNHLLTIVHKLWHMLFKWLLIVVAGVIVGNWLYTFIPTFVPNTDDSDFSMGEKQSDSCNVEGINLHGSLVTYIPQGAENDPMMNQDMTSSENVSFAIKSANEDDDIKAILVEVDSGGGMPIAGEEIAIAIKESAKPVVALIRGVGASASYLAISGADKIFASKYSDVGSIGVTGSFLNNVEKNKKDGYQYEQLTAGKYKDLGNPDKPLTAEERALYMRDINIIYENFIKTVAENRSLPLESVRAIADGSTVLGETAQNVGLIDQIGGMPEAEAYLKEIVGDAPDYCWD